MATTFVFDTIAPSTFPCISSGVFAIEAGYPTFKGGQDGLEGVIRGWINYDEWQDFINQIQPPSTYVGGNMVVQYGAEMPGFPFLRCTDWEAERYPKEAPTNELDGDNYFKHPLMYVTLYFRFVKQHATGGTGAGSNPDPVPYLIHRWSAGGQILSLDNKGLMWDDIRRKLSGGDSEPFFDAGGGNEESVASKRQRVGVSAGQDERINAVLQIPHIEHEITWPRVPRPPFSIIKQYVGCVNQFEMNFRTGRIPPECLLFTGAKVQETVMSNGETSWELVYTFAERQVVARDQAARGGWNHFFRSKTSSQVYPYLLEDDPETTFTEAGAGSGPFAGFSLDDDDIPEWFACSGLPGFYRLELNPGVASLPCMPEELNSISLLERIDLQTGYLDSLAIFKKKPFINLFRPEPITSSP